jgi:hypothetical protein
MTYVRPEVRPLPVFLCWIAGVATILFVIWVWLGYPSAHTYSTLLLRPNMWLLIAGFGATPGLVFYELLTLAKRNPPN